MPLTRPRFSQFDTTISSISDPITILNKSSTKANVDVGFIMNRDGGITSNTALFWQESANSFVLSFTSNTGSTDSNITVTEYANLRINSLTGTKLSASGNITAAYFIGDGSQLTGLPAGYSNVNVKAYTESMGFQNYGNVNVAALITTNGLTNYSNVNASALITTNGLTNYSNINLAAYLGGAVTIGGNLTVQGNLFVNGNVTTINANNLVINDSMIYLADDNPADVLDIGIVSSFTNPGYQHTGFVRDASDGVWKLFANVVAEPTTTVDFTNANYSSLYVGNIQTVASATIGSTLNVSGQTFVGELFVTTKAGQEGGQLNLAPSVTNNILSGNVVIDVFDNSLRIYESTGTNRGAFINIAALTSSVGTNLVGGGGTPGGGNGQIQFNQSSAFAGAASLYYFGANGAIVANAGIASISTTTGTMQITGGIGVTGNLWADQIYASNNGNGTNFRVGDDLWLGDVNVANTMRLMGAQDNTQAYIRFGTTQTNTLGVNGAGPLTWTGNLSAGTVGAVSGQFHSVIGNITQSTSGGAVYINTSGNILATGGVLNALTVNGNITVTTAYVVPSANATSSLGTSATKWNYIYGVYGNFQSVNANYADLAEIYTSDRQYPGGTVVVFGGSAEVMQSHSSHDPRIAGVVSTNPAYLMNSSESGVPVALQGRVPCRVLGPIEQGDRVVSSNIPGVAQRLDPQQYEPGCVIGKALQAIDSTEISVIEVVVGRV